uniref:Uncharacterized protein n=1 Tax=Streptomyces sp. HK1 TaxID=405041 RepID=B0LTZ2_9ACTN|nr:unknown [Streptomyces sp. HK1]
MPPLGRTDDESEDPPTQPSSADVTGKPSRNPAESRFGGVPGIQSKLVAISVRRLPRPTLADVQQYSSQTVDRGLSLFPLVSVYPAPPEPSTCRNCQFQCLNCRRGEERRDRLRQPFCDARIFLIPRQ